MTGRSRGWENLTGCGMVLACEPFSLESDSSFRSLRSLGAARMSTSIPWVSGSDHTGTRLRFCDLARLEGASGAVDSSWSVSSSGSKSPVSEPSVAFSVAFPATLCRSASAPPNNSFSSALACAASSAVSAGSAAFLTSAMQSSRDGKQTSHVQSKG